MAHRPKVCLLLRAWTIYCGFEAHSEHVRISRCCLVNLETQRSICFLSKELYRMSKIYDIHSYHFVTCIRVRVIYKTGFEFDDWIYWHLIHTHTHTHNSGLQAIQLYRWFTHLQFTVTHALGFSVFTNRILATDLHKSVTSNHTWSLLLTV
jgi:hypothetical protein